MNENERRLDESVLEMRWNTIRQQVKRHWDRLTEADLDEIQGNPEKLKARLQERYSCQRSVAEEYVQAFIDQYNTYYSDDVSHPMVGG